MRLNAADTRKDTGAGGWENSAALPRPQQLPLDDFESVSAPIRQTTVSIAIMAR